MRVIKIKSLLIILLYCSIFAQYRSDQINVPEGGVPLNLVYAMTQDSKGFIWFGTMYGLVRFDGEDYKVFRHDPDIPNSISYDDIISLYEDKKGFLWIGTWGGGLNVYDPEKNRFKRFNNFDENIIWNIEEDLNGNIWLATQTSGVIKYLSSEDRFIKYTAGKVNKIFISPSGEILLCTDNGIRKFDQSEEKVIPDNRFEQIINHSIFSIHLDSLNRYWIGSNNGIYIFNEGSVVRHIKDGLTSINIRKLASDRSGNIWAGTVYGLNKIGKNSVENFILNKSGSNVIQDMFFDNSGILWISTYHTGVSKLKPGTAKFRVMEVPNVISFTEGDNSNLWCASADGKLYLFDNTNKILKEIFYTGNRINSIEYKNRSLWIINHKGLSKYDPALKRISFVIGGGFTSIFHDGKKIFLGTPGMGLTIYNESDKNIRKVYFDSINVSNYFSNFILCLFKDSKQKLWAGTYGGLVRLDNNYRPMKVYKYDKSLKNSLSNNYVYSIYEDAENNLWIGTSNGLNRYKDENGTFQRYYEKNGLPNGVINGITGDASGNLWIITNKGLSEFSIKKMVFKNYNDRDGLLSNLFRVNGILNAGNGTIYLCSNEGINYFQPEQIQVSQYQPQIRISSLTNTDTELFPQNNHIRLAPTQNSIRIKFASMDYDDPLKIQYKYKLENFDDNWIDSKTENTAVYTRIPSGEYIFRVKGTNSDGIWSSNEVMLNITVLPPFYLTWWFILTCLLLGVLTIVFIVSLRIKQKMKFAIAVERARVEESEKIRMKTAMDFHDELGHHLTRITLLAGLIKRKSVPYSESSDLLDKIIENANNLYTGTKDFIWSIDPHHDSLYEVIIRLKDFGDDLFSKTDICFELNGLNEELKQINLSMDLRRNVILIFKEAMNNSLKYASSKHIILESIIKDNEMLISLQDFGKGFSGNKNDIKGLSNMRKRAERISSKLDITSIPDEGTTITLRSILNTQEAKSN